MLTAMHLGAAALVLLVSPPRLPAIGLMLLLAASLTHSLGVHGWRRSRRAITALELDREGFCSVLQGRESGWRECGIRRAVVHPWLVLLSLRIEGRRWPTGLVLAADAVEPEAFRRLRARLLLGTRAD